MGQQKQDAKLLPLKTEEATRPRSARSAALGSGKGKGTDPPLAPPEGVPTP